MTRLPHHAHILTLLASASCLALGACVGDDAMPDDGADTDAADTDGVDESGSDGVAGDCTLIAQDDLAASLTLEAGCYVVNEPLSLDAATLTMQPGVEVTFDANTGLAVTGGGVLIAEGAAGDPVVLRGATEEAGAWTGLSFLASASSDNRLSHVEVIDAGASSFGGDPTAIAVLAGARLSIANASVSGSAGFGVVADDASEMTMSSSTVTGNAMAISVGVNTMAGVAADNSLTGNDEDIAHLTGSTLDAAATWASIGIPLHPEVNLSIGAHLTLDPGVVLAMGQERMIIVLTTGALTAQATADAPITITGQLPEPGYWRGISFESKTTDNVLDGCVVEYGAADGWNGDPDSRAMIWLPEDGKLILRNTTLQHSAWYALWAYGGAEIDGMSGNTFSSNERAMVLHPELVGDVAADNEFVDNTEQFVRISHGNNDRVESTQTWHAIGVPFRLNTRTSVEGALTIDAGVVLEFEQEVSLQMSAGGSLTVNGAPDSPVVMTGAEAVAGYWKGLQFETQSPDNVLSNVVVEYAGGDGWHGGQDSEAAIYVGGSSEGRLEINATVISNSAGNGILVADDSIVDCADVTYEAIAKANTFGPAPAQCQ